MVEDEGRRSEEAVIGLPSLAPVQMSAEGTNPGTARRASLPDSQDVGHLARLASFSRMGSFRSNASTSSPRLNRLPSSERNDDALQARRRESMKKMEAMCINKSFKQAMTSALNDFTVDISADADPETKLQQVLIHAKESGMSMERIFSFFSASEETVDISEEDFASGLQQLNSEVFHLSPEDIKLLVEKFDLNKDHKISLEEFVNFCLNIPHISWKAEKSRRLSAGMIPPTESSEPATTHATPRGDQSQGHVGSSSTPASSSTPSLTTATPVRRLSKQSTAPTVVAGRPGTANSQRSSVTALPTNGRSSFSLERRSSTRSSLDNGNRPARRTSATGSNRAINKEKTAGSSGGENNLDSEGSAVPPRRGSQQRINRQATSEVLKGSLADFPLMAETSKLMWRLRENLIIKLYSHDIPPLIIAIVSHNETTDEEYPVLYVARDKVPVDEKVIEAAVIEKINIMKPGLKPSDLTPDEHTEILIQVRREYITNYLVQRLNLEEETKEDGKVVKKTTLNKQTGDEWESLLTEKPAFLHPPPKVGKVRRASLEDFQRASAELLKISTDLKRHSIDAQRLSETASSGLESVVGAVAGGEGGAVSSEAADQTEGGGVGQKSEA